MHQFTTDDVRKLLNNKFVVIIGDSVMRAMYKDLILLLQNNRLLKEQEMKKRGEISFIGDSLIEGGEKGEMTNGKDYCEVRQYCSPFHVVRFYFVTRIYNNYVETVLADLVSGPTPDVVIINSCVWDISRYGPQSLSQFKVNLQLLCQELKRLLHPETLVMWTTCLPVSQSVRGGFLIEPVRFMSEVLRIDVLQANFYASQVLSDYGFDVVDLHHLFRRRTDHRSIDGVHWDNIVHRDVTNVLLNHVCDAWHVKLPVPKLLDINTRTLMSASVLCLKQLTRHSSVSLPSESQHYNNNNNNNNNIHRGSFTNNLRPGLLGMCPNDSSPAMCQQNFQQSNARPHSHCQQNVGRLLRGRSQRGELCQGGGDAFVLGRSGATWRSGMQCRDTSAVQFVQLQCNKQKLLEYNMTDYDRDSLNSVDYYTETTNYSLDYRQTQYTTTQTDYTDTSYTSYTDADYTDTSYTSYTDADYIDTSYIDVGYVGPDSTRDTTDYSEMDYNFVSFTNNIPQQQQFDSSFMNTHRGRCSWRARHSRGTRLTRQMQRHVPY